MFSGSLNIYYPLKVKRNSALSRLNEEWQKRRDQRIKAIQARRGALTDLMDLESYRDEREYVLSKYQDQVQSDVFQDTDCSPYALKCLQKDYRYYREDSLYSKNVSVVISRFKMEYQGLTNNAPIVAEGLLLYNVNVDNSVATYIVSLYFENLSSDEVIVMKHIFYKRLKVKIEEYENIRMVSCKECGFGTGKINVFPCVKIDTNTKLIYQELTFPEFVNSKSAHLVNYDVDFRARYSLLEINYTTMQTDNMLYGMLVADEEYREVPNRWVTAYLKKDISTRKSYHIYLAGCNVMVVKNVKSFEKYRNRERAFEQSLNTPSNYILVENRVTYNCIAGIGIMLFPHFLKTLEIHYLINDVMTNEIEVHDKSYVRPWVFLRRGYKLWNIIYDLDVNRYYISKDLQNEFGVTDAMQIIKDEYKSIMMHTLSYLAAIVGCLTLLLTYLNR